MTPHSTPLPDSTGQRPPLRRIAEILGVSKMTVSRALREGTSVDPEVRQRVQDTARQIGYQPDSRISQVMSAIRKSKAPQYRETLGFIWTHRRTANEGQNSFYEEIFSGAKLQSEQLGYKLDEFRITDQAMSGRALSNILHSRGIRGVLVAPPGPERSHPHLWLEWKKFSTVIIGRSFVNNGLARVQPDHYSACVLALRRLKRLRYRRVGLVLSRSFDERTGHMVRSAFQSFHPLGPRQSEKLTYLSDQPDSKAVAKWMDQAKPEVVIANFENSFPRTEHLISHAGKPVDVVALNWNRRQPAIAGVNLQLPLVGETAVDLMLTRLQRNLFGLENAAPTIHVPGSWMDGASIRRALTPELELPAITVKGRQAKPALI